MGMDLSSSYGSLGKPLMGKNEAREVLGLSEVSKKKESGSSKLPKEEEETSSLGLIRHQPFDPKDIMSITLSHEENLTETFSKKEKSEKLSNEENLTETFPKKEKPEIDELITSSFTPMVDISMETVSEKPPLNNNESVYPPEIYHRHKYSGSGWRNSNKKEFSDLSSFTLHHKFPKSTLEFLYEKMTAKQQKELKKALLIEGVNALKRLKSNLVQGKTVDSKEVRGENRLADPHHDQLISGTELEEVRHEYRMYMPDFLDLVLQTDGNLSPRSKLYLELDVIYRGIEERYYDSVDQVAKDDSEAYKKLDGKFKLTNEEFNAVLDIFVRAEAIHFNKVGSDSFDREYEKLWVDLGESSNTVVTVSNSEKEEEVDKEELEITSRTVYERKLAEPWEEEPNEDLSSYRGKKLEEIRLNQEYYKTYIKPEEERRNSTKNPSYFGTVTDEEARNMPDYELRRKDSRYNWGTWPKY